MRIPTSSPVVVGVNGTAAGLAAVQLGAREAVARGRQLRIVHAFTWASGQQSRRAAQQLLDEATATAQRSTPGVRVAPQLLDGPPDRVLVQLSRTADLLVLGDDDPSGTPWLTTASVLEQAAARAFCPVVVARGPRPRAGPVLAAVDGSPWSVQALRHAAVEGRRLGVPVEVVHVVSRPGPRAQDEGRAVLARVIAAVPELVRFRAQLLAGDPGRALVRASTQGRQVILGPRGAGGSALLGAVARQVMHRGACPAVFVHGTVRRGEPAPGNPLSRRSAVPI